MRMRATDKGEEMIITIVCEEATRKAEYIEHIMETCMGIEHLPMKLILSSAELYGESKDLLSMPKIQSSLEQLMIENSKPLEDEFIETRGLRIAIKERRVWINGEELHFTPTEFGILAFLGKRMRQVVDNEELCRMILGKKWSEKSKATISVHIRNIRNKIEPNPKNPSYIETVRGVGYRFNP